MNSMTELAETLRVRHGHWEEHDRYPLVDWQNEVANQDTRMGYWEWVATKLDELTSDPLTIDQTDEGDSASLVARLTREEYRRNELEVLSSLEQLCRDLKQQAYQGGAGWSIVRRPRPLGGSETLIRISEREVLRGADGEHWTLVIEGTGPKEPETTRALNPQENALATRLAKPRSQVRDTDPSARSTLFMAGKEVIAMLQARWIKGDLTVAPKRDGDAEPRP